MLPTRYYVDDTKLQQTTSTAVVVLYRTLRSKYFACFDDVGAALLWEAAAAHILHSWWWAGVMHDERQYKYRINYYAEHIIIAPARELLLEDHSYWCRCYTAAAAELRAALLLMMLLCAFSFLSWLLLWNKKNVFFSMHIYSFIAMRRVDSPNLRGHTAEDRDRRKPTRWLYC